MSYQASSLSLDLGTYLRTIDLCRMLRFDICILQTRGLYLLSIRHCRHLHLRGSTYLVHERGRSSSTLRISIHLRELAHLFHLSSRARSILLHIWRHFLVSPEFSILDRCSLVQGMVRS